MSLDDVYEQIADSIRRNVAEHGCAVIAVGADPDEETPQFAYTVGVAARRGYEFAVSGADIPGMHIILNKLASRALDGELAPADGLLVEGVLENGYLLRLKPVHPSWQIFGWMAPPQDLDAQPPVWQAQFPALDGSWPEEPGYDPALYVQTDYTQPRGSDGSDG